MPVSQEGVVDPTLVLVRSLLPSVAPSAGVTLAEACAAATGVHRPVIGQRLLLDVQLDRTDDDPYSSLREVLREMCSASQVEERSAQEVKSCPDRHLARLVQVVQDSIHNKMELVGPTAETAVPVVGQCEGFQG